MFDDDDIWHLAGIIYGFFSVLFVHNQKQRQQKVI